MKKIGGFTSARWGRAVVWRGTYMGADGPTAIKLTTADGEPLATLSVNMYRPECSHDSRDLPADCFYVKEWAENEVLAAEALESGLFKLRDDLPIASSGYVDAPVWQIVGGGPSTSDFHQGDRVLYVPNHAQGDTAHPDCERGVVTSTNEVNVFVRYGTGIHAQATSPEDLQKVSA